MWPRARFARGANWPLCLSCPFFFANLCRSRRKSNSIIPHWAFLNPALKSALSLRQVLPFGVLLRRFFGRRIRCDWRPSGAASTGILGNRALRPGARCASQAAGPMGILALRLGGECAKCAFEIGFAGAGFRSRSPFGVRRFYVRNFGLSAAFITLGLCMGAGGLSSVK